MNIYSVDFVYKCQVCGGLVFWGPYYYTSDSNMSYYLPYGIRQIVDCGNENIFEFSDREGYFIENSVSVKLSFNSLLQCASHPDGISKYIWHECKIGSNDSIYDDVSGIAVLSGYREKICSPDNPRNNGFLIHLCDIAKRCETKEQMFRELMRERFN